MRVMVIVKANESSEKGVMPPAELFEAMGKYNEELAKAGILLAADGLHPSSRGVRVHFSGTSRTVTDGPFAETKEMLAGFTLVEAESMEEAVRMAHELPWTKYGSIEVRPVGDIAAMRARVGA